MKPSHRVFAARHASSALRANLRSVEDYLNSCARSQPAGCYMRDFENDQHFWSPEAFHWFGLPVAEQAPPMDQFLTLIDQQQLSAMVAAIRRCVDERCRLVIEYRVRPPHGPLKHLRSIGQPVPSGRGHGTAILGTVFDLTEFHRARAALRKAFAMLLRLDPPPKPARTSPRDLSRSTGNLAGRRTADQDGSTDARSTMFTNTSGGLSARQFSRVYELMTSPAHARLSVTELAAAAGLSAAHFARAFKQTTGKSPYRFMLEQRLECARAALTCGSHGKLASVAFDFGFFDQSHFTRHFRRKFGVTPSDFVRQSAP